MSNVHIPYYEDYLPTPLLRRVDAQSVSVPGVDRLRVRAGLLDAFPQVLTTEALRFVVDLYEQMRPRLADVLAQRAVDRAFTDAYTSECTSRNLSLIHI